MEQTVTDKLRRLIESLKRLKKQSEDLNQNLTRGERIALTKLNLETQSKILHQVNKLKSMVSGDYILLRYKTDFSNQIWESSFINCTESEAKALAEIYSGSSIIVLDVKKIHADPNPILSDAGFSES